MRQVDKLKTVKMGEMKAAGVEYDERIAELDKIEHPKPNKEFLYDTFNAFAKKHPWVVQENVRPKSIAREMFETFQSFNEYVRDYGLERGEGVLLRYLSDVYKTLVQSVPAGAKTEGVDEIVTYFGAIVRAVDSSLLDEWERMKAPALGDAEKHEAATAEAPGEIDVTANERELTVLVRNAMFGIVRAIARKDYASVVAAIDERAAWTAEKIATSLAPFWAEHQGIRVDAKARGPERFRVVEKSGQTWKVEQVVSDEEDANDWAIFVTVALGRTRETGRPVVELDRIGT
jgi:hypothetical protein